MVRLVESGSAENLDASCAEQLDPTFLD